MLLVWQQSIFTGNRVAVEAEGKFLIDFALSSKSDFLNIESHFNIYEVESHTVSVGVTLYHCRSHFITGIHTNSLKSHTVLLGVTLLSLWDTLFHWKSQYYHWRSHCITEVTLHFWGGSHCIIRDHTISQDSHYYHCRTLYHWKSHYYHWSSHYITAVTLRSWESHCITWGSHCITVSHIVPWGSTLYHWKVTMYHCGSHCITRSHTVTIVWHCITGSHWS